MDTPHRLRTPRSWLWTVAILLILTSGFAGLRVLDVRADRAGAAQAAARVVGRQVDALVAPTREPGAGLPPAVAEATIEEAVRAGGPSLDVLERSTDGREVRELRRLIAETLRLVRRPGVRPAVLERQVAANAARARAASLLIARHQHADARRLAVETALGQFLIVLAAVGLVLIVLRAGRRALEAEAERHSADLAALADLDPLTGIANRRRLAKDGATGRRPLQVVVIDLDGFKQLNDTRGHDAGDRLLVDVARSLAEHPACTPYRTGGDEFCVLSPSTDPTLADELAALIAAAVPGGIGASVGAAAVPGDAGDVPAAMRVADARMYAAKAARKRVAIA